MKHNFSIFFIIFFLSVIILGCQKEDETELDITNDYDDNLVFVIAGQSNAVGWNTGAPDETYLNDTIPNTYI